MSRKGIDTTFVHYGIRKEDMQIIENLCVEHGLEPEWLKEEILRKFHENKINENDLSEKNVKKIIERAIQK